MDWRHSWYFYHKRLELCHQCWHNVRWSAVCCGCDVALTYSNAFWHKNAFPNAFWHKNALPYRHAQRRRFSNRHALPYRHSQLCSVNVTHGIILAKPIHDSRY